MELLKLILIFGLIVVFLGLKKPTSLVIFGATILLGVLFAIPLQTWLTAVIKSIGSWSTLQVVLIIWSVMVLEGQLKNSGYLDRMMDSMDDLFRSRRVSLIGMPMLIGFLPSAGGALFSAPLVEKESEGLELSSERKAQINAYYRHIMEICFPTYPASIVICNISSIPMISFVTCLLPVMVLAFCLGLVLLRGVGGREDRFTWQHLGRRVWRFICSLWPFILLLVLILPLDMEVCLACVLVLAGVMLVSRTSFSVLPELIRSKTKWPLLLMAMSVMVFKDVLLSSGAVDALPGIISRLPVPPIVVFSLMSLFIAMITGMIFSTTAITMPLTMAAIPGYTAAAVALIHMSAFIGCQLTPTHLCIPISSDYFKANMQKMVLGYSPCYLILYAICLVVFGFIFT